MQTIDRLQRFVSFSRKKVLIVLLIGSGLFVVFNYALLTDYLIFSKNHKLLKGKIPEERKKESNGKIRDNASLSRLLPGQVKGFIPFNLIEKETISSVSVPYTKSTRSTTKFFTFARVASQINDTDKSDGGNFLGYDSENESLKLEDSFIFRNSFVFSCKKNSIRRSRKRKKNLIVYENFIPAFLLINCYESITYTTHGDYRYLGNLIPLMERWNGPISVSVYAPGDDLITTLKFISFLRECTTNKISELVTFHVFFEVSHSQLPAQPELQFNWLDSLYTKEKWKDCSVKPNLKDYEPTFRLRKRLLYPINIARNIARSAALTHFVLASDIELFPSVNLIPAFFRMLKEEESLSYVATSPRVFVLPIFEVKKGMRAPKTKKELIALLDENNAVPFHNYICRECHLVPKYEEWKNETNHSGLHVFYKAKRKPPFQYWEPIYIGTKYEPLYDERLSWEGLRDKMTQGYILCALDYDFLVLDNAFLVHRPTGIKRLAHKTTNTVLRQDRLIDLKIKSELFKRFGKQEGCVL